MPSTYISPERTSKVEVDFREEAFRAKNNLERLVHTNPPAGINRMDHNRATYQKSDAQSLSFAPAQW